MKTNTPYCYLYKNKPLPGDLYVSTVIEIDADFKLENVTRVENGATTTVTYQFIYLDGASGGLMKPRDVKIDWDGTEERWVEVIVDTGTVKHKTFTNSQKAD